MLVKNIIYCGQHCTVVCDAKCIKAWGSNVREKSFLSEDCDDYEFLSDGELGDAPIDPGTYEGGHAKPLEPEINKWCVRECERSSFGSNEQEAIRNMSDFSKRVSNTPTTEV